MTSTQAATIRERVEQLKDYINTGRVVEAMSEFYSDEVSMQENSEAPTQGLAANIEREKAFLASVGEWKWTDWRATAVDEDAGVALIEYAFQFVNTEGDTITYEQATVQRWAHGKIVSERFYHG